MVAVDEDFFVLVRVAGPATRVLLSDVTAAEEWELAQSAVDASACRSPRTTTTGARRRPRSVGDLGMHAIDMGVLSTTSSSTPTRCSPTSPARSASASAFDDVVGLTVWP